jgi:Phage Tail Collar Domain
MFLLRSTGQRRFCCRNGGADDDPDRTPPSKPAAAQKIAASAPVIMGTFVGQIEAFAFDFAPEGWLPCDGRTLPIAQYVELFSLIDASYGGDGSTNFALPKLVPLGPTGPGYYIATAGYYPEHP